MDILVKLGLKNSDNFDNKKLISFLGQIYKGYRRDVAYHNDLHGADVLEMAFVLMTQGNLIQFAELSELD